MTTIETAQVYYDAYKKIRAVADAAFFAMCEYRDGGDLECFQDAIDALGVALSEDGQ